MSLGRAPDHEDLYSSTRATCEERLPEEFVETILTGWWTTCLEVLPAKERRRGLAVARLGIAVIEGRFVILREAGDVEKRL